MNVRTQQLGAVAQKK